MNMKEALGIIAVILTFLAYIPYYRDVLSGKTHSHIYSWSLWGLLTALIIALQLKGGAGFSAVAVTAAAGLMCVGIVVLSLRHGKKYITVSDTVVAILSLVAIGFWVFANQPNISMLLVIVADILAFIPTVRKSWHNPHTETLSLYVTNTIRFGLAFLALSEYNFLSASWIVAWVIANFLFSVILIIRRKQLSPNQAISS